MNTDPLILVVEDNKSVRLAARFVLEDFNFAVQEVENPAQALIFLDQAEQPLPELILLDMNFDLDSTSGEEGLRFLRQLNKQQISIPVIAMTAWSSTDLVVQAMQLGAVDFIEKPWKNQRLEQVVRQQIKLQTLTRKNRQLEQSLAPANKNLIWRSDVMERLTEQLKSVANTDANILLTGDNGVGKSHFAQWIHSHSQRKSRAFIALNMATIPEQLFESELFGHTKGAFTDAKSERLGRFTLADGGSLFLDEIGTLPLTQQAKLLRVLESGEFEMVGSSQTQHSNVRLISATNANFQTLIQDGLFRQDLYYRLNTFSFHIPALKDRVEDIVPLAEHFITLHGARYAKPELSLSNSAKSALTAYHWPGNTRELSHIIERAVLLTSGSVIDQSVLNMEYNSAPIQSTGLLDTELPQLTLEQAEYQLIRQALQKTNDNKTQAAAMLGITKQALYRRLEKHDLTA